MSRALALARAAAVLAFVVVMTASPATAVGLPTAHAELRSSVPAADALLAAPPADVVLTFSRDIEPPPAVAVTGPDGAPAGTGDPVVQGPRVTLPVAADAEGTYLVGYRAISVDGHTIEGSFRFSVGHESEAPTPASTGSVAAGDAGSTSWALSAGAAGVLLAGAGVGVWLVRRRRAD